MSWIDLSVLDLIVSRFAVLQPMTACKEQYEEVGHPSDHVVFCIVS
jgi:hypothetical protein